MAAEIRKNDRLTTQPRSPGWGASMGADEHIQPPKLSHDTSHISYHKGAISLSGYEGSLRGVYSAIEY